MSKANFQNYITVENFNIRIEVSNYKTFTGHNRRIIVFQQFKNVRIMIKCLVQYLGEDRDGFNKDRSSNLYP